MCEDCFTHTSIVCADQSCCLYFWEQNVFNQGLFSHWLTLNHVIKLYVYHLWHLQQGSSEGVQSNLVSCHIFLVILLIYLGEWNKIYNEPCFLSGHVLFLSWFVRYSSSISWRSLRLQLDLRSAGEWQIFISFLQLACVRGQNEGAGVISLDWKCCGGCARHRWTRRAWTVCSNPNCVSMSLCVCIAHLAVTLKLNVETTWWTDPDLLAIDWHNPTN